MFRIEEKFILECDSCPDKLETTNAMLLALQALLEGWVTLKEYDFTLCPECVKL